MLYIYLYYNSDEETARILIEDKNYNFFVPGGTYFDFGIIYTYYNALPANLIADCLGTNAGNISNFQQDGADGMFASDTYVGFSFSLATSAGGLSAGNHEFAYSSVPADTTAPVITPPSEQTANTDPDKDYASLDVTSLGSASDNVDASVSITYKVGSTVLSGAYDFSYGQTTVTMDATDAAGNAAAQSYFFVTVADAQAPVITPPADQILTTDPDKDTANLDVDYLATATDNVNDYVPMTYKVGSYEVDGDYDFPVGQTRVTIDGQDDAGNVATQTSFYVTVNDAQAPVISLHTGGEDFETSEASVNVDVTKGYASVSDNIDNDLEITYRLGSTVLTGPYDFPVGKNTITLNAQDSGGNDAAQKTITFNVYDFGAPVITAPDDLVVATDAGEAMHVLDVTALGSVLDAVDTDVAIVYSVGSSVLTGNYSFPIGETVVTMDAKDADGNVATQVTFTVTVSDAGAPVLVAPPKQSAETDAGQSTATLDVTTLGSVSDNVDSDLAIIFRVGTTTLTGPYAFPVGETIVTMDAVDAAGNAAAQTSFLVSISDVTPPPIPTVAQVVINSDRTMTVIGTAEANAVITVTFPDNSVQQAIASGTPQIKLRARTLLSGAPSTGQSGSFSVTSNSAQPSGTVTVVAADVNGNVSPTLSMPVDVTSPDVVISGGPETVTVGATFSVTVTFTESVTGFETSDISVANATINSLIGSGAIYSVSLTSSGSGDISIQVPAGAASDAAGNPNEASNTLVFSDTTVSKTQELIANFALERANQLLAHQPDLTAFMRRSADGHAIAHVTRDVGTFDLASGRIAGGLQHFWFNLNGSWTDDGEAKSRYAFGALGTHVNLAANLLVGAMLQFDHQSQDSGSAQIEGTGWMVGPYAVVKAPEHPLYLEARLLYGKTDNTVAPFGTYEDQFETERFLAQVKVSGSFTHDELAISPFLDLSHTSDNQKGYTDGLGNLIQHQSITLQQMAIGFDVARHWATKSGDLELTAGLAGVGNRTRGTGAAALIVPTFEGWRGKAELGMTYATEQHGTLSASLSVDGLGVKDYENIGMGIAYSLEF